ncbi:MAG: hypothetical protein Kow006_03720 [Gammaproteobacteria bacterium]
MTDTKQTDRGYQLSLIVLISLIVLAVGMTALNFRNLQINDARVRMATHHIGAVGVASQAVKAASLRVVTGSADALQALERTARELGMHIGHLEGNEIAGDNMRIEFRSEAAVAALGNVTSVWKGLKTEIDRILNNRQDLERLFNSGVAFDDRLGALVGRSQNVALPPALSELRDAVARIQTLSDKLLVEANLLLAAVESEGSPGMFSARSVTLPALIAVVLLGILGVLLYTRMQKQQAEADRERQETEEVNKRTQAAILTLLDEMSTLADGDLTAKATVTEEITGAIADSVNYAIDELRKLVATINTTSDQVSRAARQTRATAINLAEASDHQAQQITSATQSISRMAESIEEVSKAAEESARVAKRSLDIAHKGSETVQRTILGMDNIREQIQETSKRIKRLGESSQEIGAIVGLINDIADQTNILSLNAAIQAAMAGEAGRGFAVVADEVQRLAERSTDATKQIEALIKTIQTDTNEAVHSMEQSTAGVVAGAKLAEDAGVALTEIETVSGRLFQLVTGISDAAKQQTQSATEVANTMNVIQDITQQVSAGTSETAESIGHLTELANELHESVAGFKLPESDLESFETVVGENIPELGAEAIVESTTEEMVSLAGSAGEELDLMAELSELSDTLEGAPETTTEVIPTLVETEGEEELSAAVLEELAAELDASSEQSLDVDLGATQASK